MRGVYQAQVQITSLAAAKTLIYITAPSDKVVEILSASITNLGSNVTNQQLEATLQRIGTLGTPTATTLTPSQQENGDQAASSTVKGNVTASEPTYTNNTQVCKEGFASLAGYRFQPAPEERMYLKGGESAGLRMLSTPTSFDADITITFREIG